MIYDHIRNISLYKGLSDALDMALDFIASAVLPMDNGTTLLPHGVKAIASEYETKPTWKFLRKVTPLFLWESDPRFLSKVTPAA